MRRFLVIALVGLVAAAGSLVPARAALPLDVPCPDGEVPLFAAGGTNLTNGYFFPGTAVYDGNEFQGHPLQIERGCNVHFYNLDPSAVTNGHRIMSFARKGKRPLFSSKLVNGPGDTLMITEHVRPGIYPFFCTIHAGMFGKLQVTKGTIEK